MTCDLVALRWDATDPHRLARFWAGLPGWTTAADGTTLLPDDDTGVVVRFLPTDAPRTGPNRAHLDLTSSTPEDQRRTVARALDPGARHLDVGQRPEEEHVVLADPEGNAFCVIEPGNAFLADCGRVGALACDGTQAGGYSWSRAPGRPLVWDRDGETAIRSPHGGPEITWGGPPVEPARGRGRLRLDVAPAAGGDQGTDVERLVATRLGDDGGPVEMADPDGGGFRVLPRA
jgi:hypothetical protein